jgi:hypothetical protein
MSAKEEKTVIGYALQYARNRGLSPSFPSLIEGAQQTMYGWSVYNVDGGSSVAYFKTRDAAGKAIVKAKRAYEAEFGVPWYVHPGDLPPGTSRG